MQFYCLAKRGPFFCRVLQETGGWLLKSAVAYLAVPRRTPMALFTVRVYTVKANVRYCLFIGDFCSLSILTQTVKDIDNKKELSVYTCMLEAYLISKIHTVFFYTFSCSDHHPMYVGS